MHVNGKFIKEALGLLVGAVLIEGVGPFVKFLVGIVDISKALDVRVEEWRIGVEAPETSVGVASLPLLSWVGILIFWVKIDISRGVEGGTLGVV